MPRLATPLTDVEVSSAKGRPSKIKRLAHFAFHVAQEPAPGKCAAAFAHVLRV
jgi:hypothetical protein